MEYLIGSVLTIAVIAIASRLYRRDRKAKVNVKVSFSQSRMHEILKPVEILNGLIKILSKPKLITQSTKHQDSQHVKVIISETEAYWIANSIFYVADVKDQKIIQESTRQVDTMTMDDVQLKKIMEIVEMLGENNDSGSTGYKRF